MPLAIVVLISLSSHAAAADVRSLIDAAVLDRDRGDLASAERLLREALAIAPDEGEPRLLLAETLAWQKEFEEAESLYRDALRDDPDSRTARLGLGRVLLWTGRYADARATFGPLIASDPRDLDAREERARSHYWEGDFRSAARELRAILDLDPDRPDAARDLAAIWSDAQRTFRIGAAYRDDDQPFQVRRAESSISIFTDPLTRWDLGTGTRQLVASGSSTWLPFVYAGAEIALPRAQFTFSPRIELLEHADGETTVAGGARILRRFRERHELSAGYEKEPLLLNREALDDHPTVARWDLAWRYAGTRDAYAAARIARLDYFDGNHGESADAWALIPVARGGAVLLSAGASAAWRDTDQSRFRPVRTESIELGPAWFAYRYTGAYDPYWTPIDLREVRGIVRLAVRAGEAAEIRVQATGGTATDRGLSFGPAEGTTATPPSVQSFSFVRKYSPWDVSAEFDVRIAGGNRISVGWMRSHTIFYEADEFFASVVGRF